MNPNEPRQPWSRLVAAARQAPIEREPATATYGFATRVAALAFAAEPHVATLLERFALKAVGAACLIAVLGVVVNYPALLQTANDAVVAVADEDLPMNDAISVALDFSD